MRILTFLHSFEPGGVERTAMALAAEWQALGCASILWMGRTDGAMADRLSPALTIDGPPPSRLPIAAFETLWMLWHLPAAVRRIRPDMLFCAGNSYSIVAAWLRLRLGQGCPPVIAKVSNDLHRHDLSSPVRWLYHLWLKLHGRWLDWPVAMDAAMRAEIAGYLGCDAARVTVVEDPSIRLDQISIPAARHAAREGRRFVALGRLAAQKNYRLMIEGFANSARPADTLTIYGEGPDRRALERLIAQLAMADRIRLPGYTADPAAALDGQDIFLLSSAYEGVPAVIIEALAHGLPIIATDCSASMAGLLGHGRLGRLVPAGDGEAFAAAIADAAPGAQDVAAAHTMAARFTVERAGAAYLRLFQQIKIVEANCGDAAAMTSHQQSQLSMDQTCC